MICKIYKSEIRPPSHEMTEGLHQSGSVDKRTMRGIDEGCLTEVKPLEPSEIKSIREREQISQPAFARHLNVSKGVVSDWERGVKKSGGPALRLLTIIKPRGFTSGYCPAFDREQVR